MYNFFVICKNCQNQMLGQRVAIEPAGTFKKNIAEAANSAAKVMRQQTNENDAVYIVFFVPNVTFRQMIKMSVKEIMQKHTMQFMIGGQQDEK